MTAPQASDPRWSINPFVPLADRNDANLLLTHAVSSAIWAMVASFAAFAWRGVRYEDWEGTVIAVLTASALFQALLVWAGGRRGGPWSLGLIAAFLILSGAYDMHNTLSQMALPKIERMICAAPEVALIATGIWFLRCVLFLIRNGGRLNMADVAAPAGDPQ